MKTFQIEVETTLGWRSCQRVHALRPGFGTMSRKTPHGLLQAEVPGAVSVTADATQQWKYTDRFSLVLTQPSRLSIGMQLLIQSG